MYILFLLVKTIYSLHFPRITYTIASTQINFEIKNEKTYRDSWDAYQIVTAANYASSAAAVNAYDNPYADIYSFAATSDSRRNQMDHIIGILSRLHRWADGGELILEEKEYKTVSLHTLYVAISADSLRRIISGNERAASTTQSF